MHISGVYTLSDATVPIRMEEAIMESQVYPHRWNSTPTHSPSDGSFDPVVAELRIILYGVAALVVVLAAMSGVFELLQQK